MRLADLLKHPARCGWLNKQRKALMMLIEIHIVEKVRLLVIPCDSQVTRIKNLTQTVAYQIEDALKAEFRRHRALNGVDDLQFFHTGIKLRGAFFDTPFQSGDPARIL